MKRVIAMLLTALLFVGAALPAYAGDWTVPENTELTEAARAAFDRATTRLVGVNYVPAALLAEKDGVYCILCRATAAYPGAKPSYALVYVGEDGIENIWDIWIDKHSRPKEEAAGTSPEAIRARGVLRVGTAGDYQPMSYRDPDTGEYVGFDAELARDLAKALGVEIEFVETSWPTLMEDTLAGNFDLAICGITVTDARKEQALMSEGYLENGKTVLCRAEDEDRYTSLDAINRPEVRVMENPGGLNEKFARENLPNAELFIHDVNQEIPGLVAAGEADVMITEILEAGYYVGQDERLAAPLLHEPFTHGELGVLMAKGSEALLNYVNSFLADEKESGRIDELAKTFIYLSTDSLPDAA